MQTLTDNLSSETATISAGTSSLKAQLIHSLATGIEYRHAFVEEKIRTGLAVQSKSIREQRDWTQAELAKALHKSQSWVSRLEDPNKPIPTIPTLLILAKAFDVDLDVRFAPFSQMLHRISQLTPEGFQVPSFTEEYEAGTLTAREIPDKRSQLEQPVPIPGPINGSSACQFIPDGATSTYQMSA